MTVIITGIALLTGSLAFLASLVLLPPATAQAHGYVIGSDPVDGSTIARPPTRVRIFFAAPLSSVSTANVYFIQNGQLIDVGATRASLSPNNTHELDLPLKTPETLQQGSYEVLWTAVANDDGHTTRGIIGFNIGQSSLGLSGTPTLGPSSSNDLTHIRALDTLGLLSVAWNWFASAALSLWIGILVIERFVLHPSERLRELARRTKAQTISLSWFCLGALALSELVQLLLRVVRLNSVLKLGSFHPASLASLLVETSYGHFWMLRMIFILIALALLLHTSRLLKKSGPTEKPEKPAKSEPRSNPEMPRPKITQDFHATTASITRELTELKRTTTTLPAAQPVQLPSYTRLWLLIAAIIALTYALTGETIQVLQPQISAVVFDWLRLVTQSIWFGGLSYLAFVLLPALPSVERDHHAETFTTLLQRFTPILAGSMCLLCLSLLFLSEASISDSQQLLNDPFGRTLLVQSIIFLLVLSLSAYTFLYLRTKLIRQALLLPVVNSELPARRTRHSALIQTQRKLKSLIILLSILGAIVLLCMALLAYFTPPIKFPAITYTNAAPAGNDTTRVQVKQANDLTVTLQVLPGKVGSDNNVIVTINDQQGNAVTDAKVSLRSNMRLMDMGTAVKNVEGNSAIYSATFDKAEAFDMAGPWNIDVTITRPNQPSTQVQFQVNI